MGQELYDFSSRHVDNPSIVESEKVVLKYFKIIEFTGNIFREWPHTYIIDKKDRSAKPFFITFFAAQYLRNQRFFLGTVFDVYLHIYYLSTVLLTNVHYFTYLQGAVCLQKP